MNIDEKIGYLGNTALHIGMSLVASFLFLFKISNFKKFIKASQGNHFEVVRFLIESGVKIEAKNNDGGL